ncbi:MAG TPA: FAD-dependent oxidoreductase, partial [Pyrinomonadaceae bacterium]
MNSEILIIGGGVIGLALARSLKKYGAKSITILEREKVGRESSFAAAGMLAPQAETDKTDDFFDFCLESNKLYPQFAAELFDETGIDIELDRAGTLYLAFSDDDVKDINRRYVWQKGARLAIEYLTAEEIRKNEPFVSPDVREGLFFPHDWQVENRKL